MNMKVKVPERIEARVKKDLRDVEGKKVGQNQVDDE